MDERERPQGEIGRPPKEDDQQAGQDNGAGHVATHRIDRDGQEGAGHDAEQGVAHHGGRQQADHHQRRHQQQREQGDPAGHRLAGESTAILDEPQRPHRRGDQGLEHTNEPFQARDRPDDERHQGDINRRHEGKTQQGQQHHPQDQAQHGKTATGLTTAGQGIGQTAQGTRHAARAGFRRDVLGRADGAGGRERAEDRRQQGMTQPGDGEQRMGFPHQRLEDPLQGGPQQVVRDIVEHAVFGIAAGAEHPRAGLGFGLQHHRLQPLEQVGIGFHVLLGQLLPHPDRIRLGDVERELVHVIGQRHEPVEPTAGGHPALGLGLRGELGKRPLAGQVDHALDQALQPRGVVFGGDIQQTEAAPAGERAGGDGHALAQVGLALEDRLRQGLQFLAHRQRGDLMRGQQLLAKGFPGDLAVADQFLYPQGETIQPVDAGHALAKVDPLGRFPHREPPTDRLAQIIARPARGAFGDRSHRGGFGLEGDPVPRRSPRGDIVHDQLAHVGRQHRHGQLTGLGRRRFGVERGLGKLIDRLVPHRIGQAHAAEGDPQHQYLRQGHAVDHRHQQDHATHDPQRRPDGRALRAEGFPLVRGVQHRQDGLDEEQEAQHQQ